MYLLILLTGILSQAVAQDIPVPACYRDPSMSRVRRLEGIKAEILQRLGLEAAPVNPSDSTKIIEPEVLDKYELVKESWKVKEEEKPPCATLDFHTMEILPFRPVNVEKMQRSARVADGAGCPSKL
jgi:hypothetical protein